MNDVDHACRPARFMVIAAHPDDADFGPAGTAARWIDEGATGWLVCCTSGDAGGEDPDADPYDETGDDDEDLDDGEVGDRRAGRLVDPDQGLGEDTEADLVGDDVGIDGAASSAEEAAVHIVEDSGY